MKGKSSLVTFSGNLHTEHSAECYNQHGGGLRTASLMSASHSATWGWSVWLSPEDWSEMCGAVLSYLILFSRPAASTFVLAALRIREYEKVWLVPPPGGVAAVVDRGQHGHSGWSVAAQLTLSRLQRTVCSDTCQLRCRPQQWNHQVELMLWMINIFIFHCIPECTAYWSMSLLRETSSLWSPVVTCSLLLGTIMNGAVWMLNQQ